MGQLTMQEPLRSSWGCFDVAVNLLSGHVNCVSPYHLWGTEAVFGFPEASFSWPCFVFVSPLGPFHVSDTYLAGHIQAIYTSDYQ